MFMELKRRSTLIYGLLIGVWVIVVAWQIDEHSHVQEAARRTLRSRSTEIGNGLSAVIRALRFRGSTVLQQRLEPVLDELVNGRTNELNEVGNSGVVIYIALLNTAGEPIAAAGDTNRIPTEVLSGGEYNPDGYWTQDSVTFVNPIEGASVILPPPSDFTNTMRSDGSASQSTNAADVATATNSPATNAVSDNATNNATSNELAATTNSVNRPRARGARGRPPWLRGMSDTDYSALIARHELHGLVVTLSTENFQAISDRDLWLRGIIIFFAGISTVGVGVARRNTIRTSELQLRLVRASELNSHLKEMNLAAAGLAHETRNPLNIIRGMAQMLSKETGAPGEIRDKARAIVDETDKVTVQLNEFINYSRPREVRRTKLALNSAVGEVVRALNHDIEEKKISVETKGDLISIEADEQLLRQVLFNLLLNAVQAVDGAGQIQVITGRQTSTEAFLEIRDNGPGVPPDRRREIFKPYFTTHQKEPALAWRSCSRLFSRTAGRLNVCPTNPEAPFSASLT
jgi:signal transduction histidine kinase